MGPLLDIATRHRQASHVVLAPRRFQPALTLGYQFDLLALAEDARRRSPAATRGSLQRAIGVAEAKRALLLSAGVLATDLRPTVAYLAALRVLRDLLDQGWTLDRDRDGVLLAAPLGAASAADDPAAAKGALRASFSFARAAQLATPSIARFVRDMERRGIWRLVGDGPELAARLRSVAAGERTLADAVTPVLELVDPDTRDAGTGLRLMDVWRYMRLHWSIPYQSTPGRNLFYLVRDEAGPDRPVIGIGALGNAVAGADMSPAAPAAPTSMTIVTRDYYVSRIGTFRPSVNPRLSAARRAFGRPTQVRLKRATCQVSWTRLRLRIDFENFGGAPPGQTTCTPSVGLAQNFVAKGSRFRTTRGLRVGQPTSEILKGTPARCSLTGAGPSSARSSRSGTAKRKVRFSPHCPETVA